jgi:PII-like signaling protein
MKTEGEIQLLRIYVGESDRLDGRPLYEALVRAARDAGLAGATALRGIEGFGANGRIHTVKILHLSEDLPIVVEIVDRPERIAAFLPTVDQMVTEGMVTVEKVHSVMYRRENAEQHSADDDEIPLETPADSTPVVVPNNTFQATDRAREIIETAKKLAADSRRVFIDSVDVLLAMLHETKGVAGNVLMQLGVDQRTFVRCLRDEASRDVPSRQFLADLEAKSQAEAKWLDHDYAGTEHLLLALCEIRPSAATDVLMRLGVQPREVCNEVLNILGHQDDWQRWLADHPDM